MNANQKQNSALAFHILLIPFIFVLIIGLACNQPSASNNESLDLTKVALDVQGTVIAQQGEQNQQLTQSAIAVQQAEIDAQNTQSAQNAIANAQQATQLAQTSEAQNQENNPPEPSITPNPTETPLPTDEPQPTETSESVMPNLDDEIQNAKILLFEDITKIYLRRYVKEALDGMGLSNNYTDVKDAVGNFKTELLSGTQWDLVIAAVEARSGVQGEFFTYLNDQLNDGTGVIIEHWNLDDLSRGQASTILTRCGVKISRDWWDPPNTARSIWLLQGQNPIFHQPNEGISLSNYSIYWYGDAGDLMRKLSGSDAILLAGTYAKEKNDYGTLVSCVDGRLIIQTFSSHDYHSDDMVRLWQNYIYNTLKAHFEYQNK